MVRHLFALPLSGSGPAGALFLTQGLPGLLPSEPPVTTTGSNRPLKLFALIGESQTPIGKSPALVNAGGCQQAPGKFKSKGSGMHGSCGPAGTASAGGGAVPSCGAAATS